MGWRERWARSKSGSIKVRLVSTFAGVTSFIRLSFSDIESVDLDSDEWIGDINNVTSVLKMWFRDLPEPLLTFGLHQGFIDAASERMVRGCRSWVASDIILEIENDRLRHIRLHERVNDLPDANYATLKYFMGHLNKWVEISRSSSRCHGVGAHVDVCVCLVLVLQGRAERGGELDVGAELGDRVWTHVVRTGDGERQHKRAREQLDSRRAVPEQGMWGVGFGCGVGC